MSNGNVSEYDLYKSPMTPENGPDSDRCTIFLSNNLRDHEGSTIRRRTRKVLSSSAELYSNSSEDKSTMEYSESLRKEGNYKARRTLEFSKETIPKFGDSYLEFYSPKEVISKRIVRSSKKTRMKSSPEQSSSACISRRKTVGETNTETVPARSTRYSLQQAKKRRSIAPARYGFEPDYTDSLFEPKPKKSRLMRRTTDSVTLMSENAIKLSETEPARQSLKPVHQSRVKPAPVEEPTNTTNEPKHSSRISSLRSLRSRTKNDMNLKVNSSSDCEKQLNRLSTRRKKNCLPKTPTKSTTNTRETTNECNQLKLILEKKGNTWSPRTPKQSATFTPEDDSTPKKRSQSCKMIRKGSTWSPQTPRKSATFTPEDDSTPKKRSQSCKMIRKGSTWSPRTPKKSATFTPEDDSTPKKRSQSYAMKSNEDAKESTQRRSLRSRKFHVPFQMPTVDNRVKSTPTKLCGRLMRHSVSSELEVHNNDHELSRLKSGSETPKTPRTPRMSVKQLTPSLQPRSSMVCTPSTPKDRAMKALHISSAPESLPCRQGEFNNIYNFLRQKIKGIDGGFMYVYGIPGAGKTATVERVISRLVLESSQKKVNKFQFIDINGMHLKKPKDAYCQMWKKFENNYVPAKKAKLLLEDRFRAVSTKRPILLLIDEFDMLFNRTLSVVDTLLDWIDQSRLIVVAIANSKDLIEEINKSSSKSRMLRERLYDVQFKTYSFLQLQEIIEDRLKHDNVFTSDAIQLLARKSALSGDVRLALNLCRRVLAEAGDIVEKEPISVEQVYRLLERIHKDPKIELMKTLGKQERILLQAIRDVILTSGCLTCSLVKNLYQQYRALCHFNDMKIWDEFSLFRILRLLETYAIITLSESDCTIHTEISLGNNLDYVQMAFPPRKQQ